jgi:hypothetical protein
MYTTTAYECKTKSPINNLDGVGAAPKGLGNAVVLAQPENLAKLWSTSPRTYLLASGKSVGLPPNVKETVRWDILTWVPGLLFFKIYQE